MVLDKTELDIAPVDGPKHAGYSIETTATLLAEFDKNAKLARESIAKATDEDFQYLVDQGIQRRSIHEVDSVGENWKLLKAEGAPKLEFFPVSSRERLEQEPAFQTS